MKRTLLTVITSIGISLMALNAGYAADDAPGKKVFLEHKCKQCHSVNVEKIAAEEEKSTDLSKIGSKHKRDVIKGFLLKESEIEGKKHKKKFRGDDKELTSLLDWLTSLK